MKKAKTILEFHTINGVIKGEFIEIKDVLISIKVIQASNPKHLLMVHKYNIDDLQTIDGEKYEEIGLNELRSRLNGTDHFGDAERHVSSPKPSEFMEAEDDENERISSTWKFIGWLSLCSVCPIALSHLSNKYGHGFTPGITAGLLADVVIIMAAYAVVKISENLK